MLLTLNQFLLLVLTLAVVIAVVFLITLFIQLRKTTKQGEETLLQMKTLIMNLNETNKKVNTKIDDVGDIVEATKRTTGSLSEIAFFLATKVVKPSSKYWPLLVPIIRMGWRQVKKRKKEKKNGK